jgi:hypothetical protein
MLPASHAPPGWQPARRCWRRPAPCCDEHAGPLAPPKRRPAARRPAAASPTPSGGSSLTATPPTTGPATLGSRPTRAATPTRASAQSCSPRGSTETVSRARGPAVSVRASSSAGRAGGRARSGRPRQRRVLIPSSSHRLLAWSALQSPRSSTTRSSCQAAGRLRCRWACFGGLVTVCSAWCHRCTRAGQDTGAGAVGSLAKSGLCVWARVQSVDDLAADHTCCGPHLPKTCCFP